MARQDPTVRVWTKKGESHEMHTPDNARDLVMHAGWHKSDPKVAAVEAIKEAEAVLENQESAKAATEATSFDEAEAKAKASKKEDKPAKEIKKASKPTKN